MHRATASIRKVVFLCSVIELQPGKCTKFDADYVIVNKEETPCVHVRVSNAVGSWVSMDGRNGVYE